MVYAIMLLMEMKGGFVMLICKHAENALGDKTGTKHMRSFVTHHIQKPKNSRSVVAIYVVDIPPDEVCRKRRRRDIQNIVQRDYDLRKWSQNQ